MAKTPATTYPKLGQSAWRTLRSKAASAPSSKFTPPMVAAILGMGSSSSAATNVVIPMQRLGLIDENGALTSRGNKWRNDSTYDEACQEILDMIYPQELASFTTASGAPERLQVTKWFQHENFGDSNAQKMAATYVMIAEKKLPEPPEKDQKPASRAASRAPKAKAEMSAKLERVTTAPSAPSAAPLPSRPDIHLDFQIHIAADADGDQIERIFASMAKYLYPAT